MAKKQAEPMMTLHFTRAKSFVDTTQGTKKFLAQPANRPQSVPMWVAGTQTFKDGVNDGSISNLTPPHMMPGYVWPTQAEVEAAAKVPEPVDEAADEAEDDEEEDLPLVPQAPFGAQPMTPVAPAPRIGNVRKSRG